MPLTQLLSFFQSFNANQRRSWWKFFQLMSFFEITVVLDNSRRLEHKMSFVQLMSYFNVIVVSMVVLVVVFGLMPFFFFFFFSNYYRPRNWFHLSLVISFFKIWHLFYCRQKLTRNIMLYYVDWYYCVCSHINWEYIWIYQYFLRDEYGRDFELDPSSPKVSGMHYFIEADLRLNYAYAHIFRR